MLTSNTSFPTTRRKQNNMWLAIIAVVDKLLGLLATWLPWKLKRSDESKKKRDLAQADMNSAAKIGDFDAWKKARHDRNRA